MTMPTSFGGMSLDPKCETRSWLPSLPPDSTALLISQCRSLAVTKLRSRLDRTVRSRPIRKILMFPRSYGDRLTSRKFVKTKGPDSTEFGPFVFGLWLTAFVLGYGRIDFSTDWERFREKVTSENSIDIASSSLPV